MYIFRERERWCQCMTRVCSRVCITGSMCLSHLVFLSPLMLCYLCSLLQLCTCLRCVTSCLSLLLPPVRCLYVFSSLFLIHTKKQTNKHNQTRCFARSTSYGVSEFVDMSL